MTKSQITPFPLRLAPDLREKLDAAARASGRSLQSEIAARLARTLDEEEAQQGTGTAMAKSQIVVDVANLAKLLAEHLRKESVGLKPRSDKPGSRNTPAKRKG